VEYREGESETYILPIAYSSGEEANEILNEYPQALILQLHWKQTGERGILFDALVQRRVCKALFETIARRRHIRTREGEILAYSSRAFRHSMGERDEPMEPSIMKAEQTNTSVLYGKRFILKLIRRLGEGVNPDLEIGRFLTEKGFKHIPPVAGSIEYRKAGQEPMTLGILQGFVPNQGDAWEYTLDVLGHYFERALVQRNRVEEPLTPQRPLPDMAQEEAPPIVFEVIGPYLEMARLLGQRTAELHQFLASDSGHPRFAPERFSTLYQRSLYQSMRALTARICQLVRQRLKNLPEATLPDAQKTLELEPAILERFRAITKRKITAQRIRCHGDYHLGQVLYTGKDFVIIDFEGEPARPISERRIKGSPLRDVAGMLRSFHYAAYSALFAQEARGMIRHGDWAYLESWATFWCIWVSANFLNAYLEVGRQGEFLPETREDLQLLLEVFLLEKAIYELGYEINNRPDWVRIPIQGILQLLNKEG